MRARHVEKHPDAGRCGEAGHHRDGASEADRIGREAGDEANMSVAGAVSCEKEWDKSPREGVVEIVHEAGLRAGAQRGVAIGGVAERLAEWRGGRRGVGLLPLLERHVFAGVPHESQ